MGTTTKPDLEAFAFFLRYPPEQRGRRRPKGESTIQAYIYTVERYLSFLAGRLPGQENAREFVQSLEADNGPRSVGRHIYALRSYFQHLGQGELELGAPSYSQKQPRWLNDQEWARVLETVEMPLVNQNASEWDRRRARFKRSAVMVYGGAGLRLAEGCALQRSDLTPDGYLKVLGKGGDEKTIPVEEAVVTAVDDWLACHDSPWVFPGKGEGHLNPRTMQQVIQDVLIEAGIENIHRAVHMLRHTAGADLRKRGADIRDIQQFLRHSNISSTQIYTQMAVTDLKVKLPRRFTARQGRML